MPLKFLVFFGSVRESTPPRPARLGERVARACQMQLTVAGHDVELVDPLQIDLPRPFKPHFSYASGRASDGLNTLAGKISDADIRSVGLVGRGGIPSARCGIFSRSLHAGLLAAQCALKPGRFFVMSRPFHCHIG